MSEVWIKVNEGDLHKLYREEGEPDEPDWHDGIVLEMATIHETAVGELRVLKRTLEMQANIMRDPIRTGGWAGANRVANAFDSAADRLATIILTQEPALNQTRTEAAQ